MLQLVPKFKVSKAFLTKEVRFFTRQKYDVFVEALLYHRKYVDYKGKRTYFSSACITLAQANGENILLVNRGEMQKRIVCIDNAYNVMRELYLQFAAVHGSKVFPKREFQIFLNTKIHVVAKNLLNGTKIYKNLQRDCQDSDSDDSGDEDIDNDENADDSDDENGDDGNSSSSSSSKSSSSSGSSSSSSKSSNKENNDESSNDVLVIQETEQEFELIKEMLAKRKDRLVQEFLSKKQKIESLEMKTKKLKHELKHPTNEWILQFKNFQRELQQSFANNNNKHQQLSWKT
jgi:hypothetical protein